MRNDMRQAIREAYAKHTEHRDHTVKISISLPSRLLATIESYAKRTGITRSQAIYLVLTEHFRA